MQQNDERIVALKNDKNELEQLAYDLRDSVNQGDLGKCCGQEEKSKILKEVENVLKWLKEQSKYSQDSDIKAQKQNLKKVSSPSILKLQETTLDNMFYILNKSGEEELKDSHKILTQLAFKPHVEKVKYLKSQLKEPTIHETCKSIKQIE